MTYTHENFDRDEGVRASSERDFGFVFAVFLAVVGILPMFRGHGARWWALLWAAGMCLVALFAPQLLAPVNRGWTALGTLLHRVTSPIILGVLFYAVFTPFGWILRLMGKDFLRLKRASDEESYWLPRRPPGPPPDTMPNQF